MHVPVRRAGPGAAHQGLVRPEGVLQVGSRGWVVVLQVGSRSAGG